MSRSAYRLLGIVLAILALVVVAAPSAVANDEALEEASETSPLAEKSLGVNASYAGTAAAAAGYNIIAHHYNLFGNKGTPSQRTEARNLALFLAEVDGAWSLSLNEACFSDVTYIAYGSARMDDRVTWTIVAKRADNCGTYSYGIASLSTGAWDNELVWQYAAQVGGAGCSIDTGECRKMLCRRCNVFGIITTSCTTHLQPNDTSTSTTARQQALDYEYLSTYWAAGTFRYLAGDFNLNAYLPVNPVPQIFYDFYRAGAVGKTWHTRTSENRRIDFIWVQNGGGAFVTPRGSICQQVSASDHCYLAATMQF